MKSPNVVLIACAALCLAGSGCGKAGSSAEAGPAAPTPKGEPQVVGVGDEQQAAKLAVSLNDRAAAGHPDPVEVHARYALAWGCPCAPIILANASSTPPQGSYLLPVVAGGETNPAEYEVVGEFRMFGHYAGTQMPLRDWLSAAGGATKAAGSGASDAHLRAPYLRLDVDHWCYVPPGELDLLREQVSSDDFAARMVEIIDRLHDEGRFCDADEK